MQLIRVHGPLKIKGMSTPPAFPGSLQLLLGQVSRSFGLSLRLLPASVRPVISLAYLLARTSDTLADASFVPAAQRQLALQAWLAAVDLPLEGGSEDRLPTLQALFQVYRQADLPTAEWALLQTGPECLKLLNNMSDQDQDTIRRVMGPIGQGQLLDLQRSLQPLALLSTEEDLNTYTWQVAGCVGRFWTECLQNHLPGALQLPQAEMRALGEHYGCGLQRLNILLDAAQDLRDGRCYFPEQSLHSLGLTAQELQQASLQGDVRVLHQLMPLQTQGFDQVENALREGLRYSCALDNWRLRLASALPALVGAASLHMLRHQPTLSLMQRLKWPRTTLQKHLLLLVLQGASRKALQHHFEILLQAPANAHGETMSA